MPAVSKADREEECMPGGYSVRSIQEAAGGTHQELNYLPPALGPPCGRDATTSTSARPKTADVIRTAATPRAASNAHARQATP
eukprot:641029-Rhodomonas_salina.2